MKTRNKVLSLTLASALLTTSAFSQVTVSGYVETSVFSGNTKGATNPTVATKSIGNESFIKLAGTGKMPTGQNAGFYITIDSDNSGIIHERGLDVGIVNDLTFQYGFDRAFGSEIARTLTPYATNRIQDISATTGTVDFQDVTSGEHAVGITFSNFAGAGSAFSAAFAPNMDAVTGTTSDGLLNTSGQTGYGAGLKIAPVAGLTLGAGYTKADSKNTANKDMTSKTLGFTFAKAPFAIGAQRHITDGQKTAVATVSEDKVNVISATFSVSKEITLGYAHSDMERTRLGEKSTDDAKVNLVSVAYSLGPVVLSLDHERAENIALAGTSGNVAGNDTNLTKAKVRVAF